jgi:hypothetical protein
VHGLVADSEPPTHDDWNPENVEQPSGQRLVRKFLKDIDEVARKTFESTPVGGGVTATPVSVGVANFLGGLIGIEGRRNSTPTPPAGGGGAGSAHGANPVVFGTAALEISNGCRTVVFRVRRPASDNGVSWIARPQIVIDGKSAVDADEGFSDPPEVAGWEDPEGNVVCVGNRIADNQRREVGGKELRVRVRLPRAYVVALKLEVEGDAAGLRVESEVNP